MNNIYYVYNFMYDCDVTLCAALVAHLVTAGELEVKLTSLRGFESCVCASSHVGRSMRRNHAPL